MKQKTILMFILVSSCAVLLLSDANAKVKTEVQASHTKEILKIAIDPNGKYIVSGGYDKAIKIWDLKTGKLLRTLEGHLKYINALEIDPKGQFIVSGGNYENTKIWDLKTGKLLRTLEGKGQGIKDVAIDPSGNLIITANYMTQVGSSPNNKIKIWDLKTGKLLRTLKGHSLYTNSVAVDPTGKYIISAGGFNDHTIKIWHLKTGRLLKTIKGHTEEIGVIEIDPKGKVIVSGSSDKTIKIWKIGSGRLEKTLKGHSSSISTLAIDPTGQLLVSGSYDKTIKIWDLKTGKLLRTLKKDSTVATLAIDPNGKFIFTGSSSRKSLNVWELKTGKLIKNTNPELNYSISALAVDPKGRFIASGSGDKTVKIWDPKTGKLLRTLEGHSEGIISLAVDPKGRFIASGSGDKTVKIWDPKTGKLLRTLKGFAYSNKDWWTTYMPIVFDPMGQLIIVGNSNEFCYDANCRTTSRTSIEVWNLDGNKLFQTPIDGEWIQSLAVDPEGHFIISGGVHGTINIRHLTNGKLIKTLEGHSHNIRGLAVDPFGKFFISAGIESYSPNEVNDIKIWDLKTMKLIRTLKGHVDDINSIVIDKDGKYVFSGSDDHTVKVWNLKTGKLINTLKGHSGSIRAVSFNSKKQIIISVGEDGTLKLWDFRNNMLLATFYMFHDASIVLTSEGYFSGTGYYSNYIYFVDDNLSVYEFDQFSRKFYRPEMVELALDGKALPGTETIESVVVEKPGPKVDILSPHDNFITSDDTAEVQIRIEDNGGGIGDVYVYVNDSLVSNDTRALKMKDTRSSKTMSFNVALSQGKNNIKVIAYNKDNSMSSHPDSIMVTSDYKYDAPTLYVLAVGIDKYNNDELDLKYAKADANLFSGVLKNLSGQLFKEVRVISLSSAEETTRQEISKTFEKLSGQIRANDYFIFYNSSHGYIATFNNGDSKYFLVTSNTIFLDPDNLNRDAISQDELVKLIGSIPAQNKILVLDTCHSGEAGRVIQIAMAETQKVYTRALSSATAMQLIKMASGSSVFTASQGIEEAIEGYKGHGLFTYTLVEGIKGRADENKDKFVTLSELKGYVEKNVFLRSKQHFKRKQVPYINIGSLDLSISQVN